jgi:hypothetical protein
MAEGYRTKRRRPSGWRKWLALAESRQIEPDSVLQDQETSCETLVAGWSEPVIVIDCANPSANLRLWLRQRPDAFRVEEAID